MSQLLFSPSKENQLSEYIYKMPIEGMLYLKHKQFPDDRGFYAELSRIPEIESALGKSFLIKQLNLSHSKENVTRGFHAEDWNKLLTVVNGSCFCAWADLRPNSKTFGDTITMNVDAKEGDNFVSIFVSSGIANSFCAANGPVDYLYAVDALYNERDTSLDVAISLFDPDLAINWPIDKDQMVISDRDKQSITLREKFPEQFNG